MKEEEKLLNLDIQKDQQKQTLSNPHGIKLYFFNALYTILQNDGFNQFCNILLIIFQFIQLMAFPMDTIFSSGWKNYWYSTIGPFFRYSQLITLWKSNFQFYLITYIIIFLYILFILIGFIYLIIQSSSISFVSKFINKIMPFLIELEIALNIPFLRTLFAVYICENDNLEISSDIKCNSSIHIFLIVISTIFIFIFLCLFLLFRCTLFEYGVNYNKLKAAYTSSTEVLLEIAKFLLIILYQFITEEVSLSIITFVISLILLLNFIYKEPFSNGFIMKLYLILYLLFFWSSTICIISILLRNSKFEGGVLLLLIGYPLIIISISLTEWDFSFDKIFEFINSKDSDGYKALLDIEYFLKMEDILADKIRTKEQKILYSYISNYEKTCADINCALKKFLSIPLKLENFVEMKIFLLQHGEMLYKNALAKFPFNAKLRLSYGLFLFSRLHKKLQGINEITLLNKFNTNLEDSFLIYKAQRYIQENYDDSLNLNNNSNQEQNSNFINSITYKNTLNNVKSLIGKITINYIDFWTILAISDENKSDNFQKMSQIGTKISKLSEELLANIDKLEKVNLYDPDIFKLYIQYLIEILSDNTQASIYNNKLSENDQQRHQYNEENLYELNYNVMAKSEDYKYIVLNCSPSKFNSISNVSLSICSIFGYSKEELIGHPYDYLLPELFCVFHKNVLQNKVDEFKKKLLIKNTKIRSDSWTEESFVRNKMKYLVPLKIRWNLVSSEEEIIYAIGKIIADNKTPIELEQEIVYILTNKNLIIQNFTPNAPKLLFLQSSAINNNLDITEFIKEFNEDYISNIDHLDIKESYISNISNNSTIIKKKERYIKREILKHMFLGENDTKKVIHWKLGDIIANEMNKGNKKGIFEKRASFVRMNIKDIKFKSAFLNFSTKNLPNNKAKPPPKRKTSMRDANKSENESTNYRKLSSSHTEEKILNYEQEKLMDLKDVDISELNDETSYITNDKISKDKIYYNRQVYKFCLSVKEVKFNNIKIGYIFKFEPYSNNLEETIITNINKNQRYSKYDLSSLNKQEYNNDIEKSEISYISFAGIKQPLEQRHSFQYNYFENPFDLTCDNNDFFFINLNNETENEFTIDINNMSFKQIRKNDKSERTKLYDLLKKQAIEKISKAAGQIKNEELSEEDEDSSSGTYNESENDNSNNTSEISSEKKDEEESSHQSTKDIISQDIKFQKIETNSINEKKTKSIKSANNNIPKPSISSKNAILNINLINNNNTNKHKDEDYYHVNFSKITYYIYNFNSGFVEVIKDQKYKVSQVVKQTNAEKEKLSKMNAKYIVNPKLAKEKKRGNINKKITNDSDEINIYNEQSIKLKEIQKALTSKEKQMTIINLCIFSFIIFALIIGTGVVSIIINFYLKNETYLFYNLIKSSIQLYRNILFEITFVREMIIINSTYYNNFYDPDKDNYYTYYSNKCYEYYIDSGYIISNLTLNIETLNERQINLLSKPKITCYVLANFNPNGTGYTTKYYDLLIYSAFRELNAALYHISQLTMKEIYTYDDNVYYFIKNGMSNLLISSENQIKAITEEFHNIIKSGHSIIIICFVALLALYVGCYFVFNYFYEKVEERKQSYLSVFYEIGGEFIILSLAKCEKFSQKLQLQEDNLGVPTGIKGFKKSLDYSSNDDFDIDGDIQTSSIFKPNKENKITTINKDKNIKNVSLIKIKIIGFILFFILLIFQYSSYIYYYIRLSLYNNCIKYEYHLTDYMSNFLFPFIGIREYICDKRKSFYNIYVKDYIDDTLFKFYTELAKVSDKKDEYLKYFPQSYTDYLNDLYSNKICDLINDFINRYPDNGYINCTDFFYGSSDYGFFSILTMYIEEIRYLKDIVDEYNSKAEKKYYIYNESFFNNPNGLYEKHYDKYKNDEEEYRKFNPINTLHYNSHKTIFIVYNFIISKVIDLLLDKLFLTFEDIFSTTTKISLIINITFIAVITIGFFLIWLPFILMENETMFKTKNMLSIIPNELLINLPHINAMLGIEEEKI